MNITLLNIIYVYITLKWKCGKKYVLTCEIFFTIDGILLYTANVVLIWFPLQNPFLFSNKVLLLNNVIVTIQLCGIVLFTFWVKEREKELRTRKQTLDTPLLSWLGSIALQRQLILSDVL